MTMRHRLSASLIAAALVAGSLTPAAAAELPPPAKHKVVKASAPAARVKKPARHRLIRIASAQALPGSRGRLGRAFPLVLGVAY
jgi:hypothetical protein